ncbi:hypothetical protein DW322_08535 [Rhodococcus rhodnii]|uniref:Uncharacterized protein n=1 Tax=Rhodococcus rhodnii TaxID=38312 RepID=A0A6P2CE78_9NOCA|nr:hypothetical protein DW322_08535 [Rhodococcus rhodnii]
MRFAHASRRTSSSGCSSASHPTRSVSWQSRATISAARRWIVWSGPYDIPGISGSASIVYPA